MRNILQWRGIYYEKTNKENKKKATRLVKYVYFGMIGTFSMANNRPKATNLIESICFIFVSETLGTSLPSSWQEDKLPTSFFFYVKLITDFFIRYKK